MKLIPLTKGFSSLVDDADFEYLNRWKWHYANGYGRRRAGGKVVHMHSEVMKATGLVDHIDRDGLNNQRANLRLASRSQNMANSRVGLRNTSGAKGVSWYKRLQRWRAYGTVNGTTKELGYFRSYEMAVNARAEFMKAQFGKYASEG